MANFLNIDGLSALWAKIKATFYTKTQVDALISDAIVYGSVSIDGSTATITNLSIADIVNAYGDKSSVMLKDDYGDLYYLMEIAYERHFLCTFSNAKDDRIKNIYVSGDTAGDTSTPITGEYEEFEPADDTDVLNLLTEFGYAAPLADSTGAVIKDKNNNIILG